MSEEFSDDTLAEFNNRHDYWSAYLTEWMKKNPTRGNGIENVVPHKAITAFMMLEEGATRKSIESKLGWNYTTCRNFEIRHFLTIQENKKKFSRAFAHATHEGLEVAAMKWEQLKNDPEALAKTSPKDIAIAVGIFTDKGAMMDGMATQTIEVRRGVSVGDAQSMIEAARQRIAAKSQVLEAEVVNP